jgi:UDP-perosamine 4-acetyltransferase
MLGAGGHARVLLDVLAKCNLSVDAVVAPEMTNKISDKIKGIPYIGDDEVLLNKYEPDSVKLVNGVGSTSDLRNRSNLYKKFCAAGYEFINVIHPTAILASRIEAGKGIQVMAGVVVQPGVSIGENTIINTGANIDHDCCLGAHVHIAPGVTFSGEVKVGNGTHVGAGSTVIQGIKIGQNSLIAAGATVIDDVAEDVRVAGVPARRID